MAKKNIDWTIIITSTISGIFTLLISIVNRIFDSRVGFSAQSQVPDQSPQVLQAPQFKGEIIQETQEGMQIIDQVSFYSEEIFGFFDIGVILFFTLVAVIIPFVFIKGFRKVRRNK